MRTSEVLRTARALLKDGRSVHAASFGDWPDAVDAFDRANRLTGFCGRVRGQFMRTRWQSIRALDRAVALAEREEAEGPKGDTAP